MAVVIDGNTGIDKVQDGSIGTADLAASAVTAAKLDVGQIGGRRNLIINGAMQVAQRDTSSTSDGYATVDRFTTDIFNGTATMSQEDLSSGSPYDLGFRKFFRMTNTTGNSGTDTRRRFYQVIESQNLANSGWNNASSTSYITISFWVRSSLAGDYYFYLQSRKNTNYTYIWKETLSANTWTKVTKTVGGDSNADIGNDNGDGMRLVFNAYHGTDFTGSVSLDQWLAFDNLVRYPDDTNGWGTTNGATYDVTGVQLEVGDTATPFEHRSYGEELSLCQRYYQIVVNNTFREYIYNVHRHPIPLRVSMRTAPTITVNHDGSAGPTTGVDTGYFTTDSGTVAVSTIATGNAPGATAMVDIANLDIFADAEV